MVLVNEALGYRVCLECLDVLQDGDEQAWMSQHIGDAACARNRRSTWRRVADRILPRGT
jgi:hypothetical protein